MYINGIKYTLILFMQWIWLFSGNGTMEMYSGIYFKNGYVIKNIELLYKKY